MDTQHLHFRDRAARRMAAYELTSYSRVLEAHVSNDPQLALNVLAMPARAQDWAAVVPDVSKLRSSGIHRFDVIRTTRSVGDYHSRLRKPGPLREVAFDSQPLMLRHTFGWAVSDFARCSNDVSRQVARYLLTRSAHAPVIGYSYSDKSPQAGREFERVIRTVVSGLAGKLSTVLWSLDAGNSERTLAISLMSDSTLINMASEQVPQMARPIAQEIAVWAQGAVDPALIYKRVQILDDVLSHHMKDLATSQTDDYSMRDSSWEIAMAYQAHRDQVMAQPMPPIASLVTSISLKDRSLIGNRFVRLGADEPLQFLDLVDTSTTSVTQLSMEFP